MKQSHLLILFLILLNCSSSKYYSDNFRILSLSSARASQKAIESNSPAMKQSTCCDAGETLVKSNNNFLNTTVEFSGDELNYNLKINTKGKVQTLGLINECKSSLNDFEECTCELKSEGQTASKLKINTKKQGWVDDSTYYTIVEGKASESIINKNSQAMKEVSCIENTRQNAIANMLIATGKKGTRDLSSFQLKFSIPPVYYKSCESISGDFETCKCEIAIQEDNLMIRLLQEWPDK
jgi:regulatory protein YycH of two-component signal transduction system YycFG